MGRVTKAIREEVKDGTEARRVTKEEEREDTKDGSLQEVTLGSRAEPREVKALSRTASVNATSAEVKATSPPIVQAVRTR